MHRLATLSEEERNRILTAFYDEEFGGLDIEPEFGQRMRSVTPDLPEDPTPEQVEVSVELAELVQEPGFRRRVREMSEGHSAARAAGDPVEVPSEKGFEPVVAERAGAALAAGVGPRSPDAADALTAIVDALRGESPDTAELRASAAERLQSASTTAATSCPKGMVATSGQLRAETALPIDHKITAAPPPGPAPGPCGVAGAWPGSSPS